MDRRCFLRSGAIVFVATSLVQPGFVSRLLASPAVGNLRSRKKTLICIFQRGAVDGLNMVVPWSEKNYYAMRPRIAIPRPGQVGGALDLGNGFGLHPSMTGLRALYGRNEMAVIHAVGSPSSTRSHFDAQDYMESGTPDIKGTPDGWLNRVLQAQHAAQTGSPDSRTPFEAVALSDNLPRVLSGDARSVAIADIGSFIGAPAGRGGAPSALQSTLERLYTPDMASRPGDLVVGAGRETLEAVKMLKAADPLKYNPENGADYPRSPFGNQLKQIVQLIKADVGVEIAFADVGGWDTHVNQGGADGQLSNRLKDFDGAISALVQDLGDRMDDVAVLTMSEFGRTAAENGNGGTDHGHANAMFVIGAGVKGGRVAGDWPGLEREQLNEGRDLRLTTDFRDLFSEVVGKHLGITSMDSIFPGFKASPGRWKNIMV